MAYVPDEAIVGAFELSPGAWRLFGYYCMKRNKHQGGWYCPKSMVLAELKGMEEATYFRSKRELLNLDWIAAERDYITPLKGFRSVKNDQGSPDNEPPEPVENDSFEDEIPVQNDAENGEFSDENTVKSDSKTIKSDSKTIKSDSPPTVENDSETVINDSGTVKSDSETVKNDSSPLKESLPDITKQFNQEEKNKQKVSGTAGLSQGEKIELEIGLIFAYWQKVLNHAGATFDDKRKSILRSKLKAGYSVETLMAVIDGVKNSPWHMGKNPERKLHHKFDTIFRDADQIESFVELAKGKPPPAEDDPDIQVPARMSFAEIIEIAYDINGTEETHQNYQDTRAGYLGEAPGAEMIEEVSEYERGNDYRQRFGQAG